MGFFDKVKSAVDNAKESINKAVESVQSAKDPLADPIVKKYYDVTYGLMKTVGRASYDAIKKYIEYQLSEPCDETKLQKVLECYWGSPLYHIIGENTFNIDKQKKIEEVNKALDALELYRCTKEEAYNICYKKEIEEISAEFDKVLNVVDKYGFERFKEGMSRIKQNYYKELGSDAYDGIVHMVVKKKFFELNSTTEMILTTCLDHATYRYNKINGRTRIASIVLRALNFEKHGSSQDGYATITKEDCLNFVLNNEDFQARADELTEENPYGEIDHNSNFADSIMNVDIMFNKDEQGLFAETDYWMPKIKIEPYYTDKVCYLYWKSILRQCENEVTEANDIYDVIWEFVLS